MDANYPYKINTKPEQNWVKKLLKYAYGVGGFVTKHPGAQPVSLLRKHFPELKTESYMIAEKSDGVRYLLCMGKFGAEYYATLVDRSMEMYQVQLRAPESYFQGTVLDGELVDMGSHFVFAVFDMICLGGQRMKNQDFVARYTKCHELQIKFLPDELHRPFSIRYKPFYKWSYFGSLVRTKPDLPTDGYIFMPVSPDPIPFTQHNLFKWKPIPTVDLYVGADGLQWSGPAKRLELIKLEETTHRIVSAEAVQPSERSIVEMTVVWSDNVCLFNFLRMRSDKTVPNSKQTVLSVIQASKEQITLQELINLS